MSYTIRQLRIDDADYPVHLRSISKAPQLLYYIGDISLISTPLIGIVGTRRSSPYGRWAAKEIASAVARCGIPVVSGMAEGIDSAAHWGCLEAGTGTVAVLGTGIDIPYPESNIRLYNTIAHKGLILSEYAPGTIGWKGNFPERNRIISGLSKSVVVVEGALKSGSMITARLALEQGRDVFAVPGNINQPNSVGVNKLICDGAEPILSIEDAVPALGLGRAAKGLAIDKLSDDEKLVLGAVIEHPGSNSEYIAMKTGLSMRETSVLATALELKGLLFSEGRSLFVSK
ncbi:MAG: DNA-processing protein DprA [Firmicutes bacterium]|nr:DNA-processing protein DprA [Bacillota bacterium]